MRLDEVEAVDARVVLEARAFRRNAGWAKGIVEGQWSRDDDSLALGGSDGVAWPGVGGEVDGLG